MRTARLLLAGAAAVTMTMAMPGATDAAPGDPGEPQALVWVDGATLVGSPQDQFLSGQGFSEDEEVDFYINDVLVAENVVSEVNAEGSYTPSYLPDETIIPGDVVRLEGDVSGIRELVVTSLAVTAVNAGLDQVTGIAGANSDVMVVTSTGGSELATADGAGNWTVSFPDDAIGVGMFGIAIALDDDGDGTVVAWAPSGRAQPPYGFGDFDGGWDDGASVDFGFGETSYLSCPEVPEGEERECPQVEWKFDEKTTTNGSMIKATIKLADVRYVKENPESQGPEYFDVISGIFLNQVSFDSEGSLERFTATWSWKITTDDGVTYQTTGQIRDFDDGEAPWDYHEWRGPIIEP